MITRIFPIEDDHTLRFLHNKIRPNIYASTYNISVVSGRPEKIAAKFIIGICIAFMQVYRNSNHLQNVNSDRPSRTDTCK